MSCFMLVCFCVEAMRRDIDIFYSFAFALIAASTECSVCKDEFVKEDTCLQLPCKHIFHDECIKPWLKTSATCPTW